MANKSPIPIAVIGLGCRFPGGANNPEELWQMLSDGRSGWSEVPSQRWNSHSFFHTSAEAKDGINVHGGHFLDHDISAFDPAFFGISGNEAEGMDPQQRTILETTYEALENAGIPQESLRGSDTGVYVGYFARDWDRMVFKDTSDLPKQHITGAGDAIVSNRISYVFDLKGPSMTVDTGCSGSMVALHLACQSLRAGETSLSIVGGVNLHLSPDYDVTMSFVNVLNKDGKCFAFDSRGSGYGRGEGSATIVLKRLDEALADGDNIRGVIRNSGINQDGKTNGISLPNKQAQKDLIRSVYGAAYLDPFDTGYVEAHGTGTVAGDQAEVESIAELFCGHGKRDDELLVGSVKSNIGHLEAASGIAGVIKALLVLEYGYIPPNINLEVEKEGLHLQARKIRVPRKLERWSKSGVRRASVNSYGYGGTNCHAILEAAPKTLKESIMNGSSDVLQRRDSLNGVFTNGRRRDHATNKDNTASLTNGELPTSGIDKTRENKDEQLARAQLFVLTAKSRHSLEMISQHLLHFLATHNDDIDSFYDLLYTLSCRRSLLQWRSSIIASTLPEFSAALDPGRIQVVKSRSDVKVVFVFTGQGAQWPGMGHDLLARYPVFKESLDVSTKTLKNLGADWDLLHELTRDKSSSRINQSDISQPATTAIQLALIDLLRAFGIKPRAVVGHSSGEIAAAYAAEVITHEAALMVSYRRGFVATACRNIYNGGGAMLATGVGEVEISPYIRRLQTGVVCIACVNSPSSTTISGDVVAIDELKVILDAASIFNRKLKVDVAYHSHHMSSVSTQYLNSIEDLITQSPCSGTEFSSSVTGELKMSGFGPDYWVKNLVSQVKFSTAMENLCRNQQNGSVLVEIGPHSALQGPIRQTLSQAGFDSFEYSYLPTLHRGKDGPRSLLELSRHLFESGCPISLETVNSLDESKRQYKVVTDLPPYAWDHSTTYWKESRLSRDHRLRAHPYHDLLGLRIVSSTINEPIWRHIVNVDRLPWLRDHVVDNTVIFPGAGYLCMAIEAMRQITQDRRVPGTILNYVCKDVSFTKALVVPESSSSVEILLSLTTSTKAGADRSSSSREDFRISSLAIDGFWKEHCSGSIGIEFASNSSDEVEGEREDEMTTIEQQEQFHIIDNASTLKVDTTAMYEELMANGNSYGPTFALVKELRLGDRQAIASIEVPDIEAIMPSHFFQPHVIHPTTLDALMQIEVPLFNQSCGAGAVMPVFAEEILVSAKIVNNPGSILTAATEVSPAGTRSLTFTSTVFQLLNNVQTPVVRLVNGEVQRVGGPSDETTHQSDRRNNYKIEWSPNVNFLKHDTIRGAEITDQTVTPQQRMETLDRAASLYISQCLQAVGDDESQISKKHHLDLFDWMKRYKSSDQYTNCVDGVSTSDMAVTFNQLQSLGADGEMLTKLGINLESILYGKIDPLSLMLEQDLLYRVYAENVSIQQCYSHMVEYIKLLSVKEPAMKILEIGAGTGSATVHTLDALNHDQGLWVDTFDFTDISSAFFEKAKPKFEEYVNYMDYKTLDIEKDPLGQGFADGAYDLIIASNVLHATICIGDTLVNVRKLLKPGGRLILVELTKLRPYLNITFGTLQGWWAGVEDDRKDSPLLSIDLWNQALLRNGFAGVEVAIDDFEGTAQTGAFIVSRATLHTDEIVLPSIEVICSSTDELLQIFARNLVDAFNAASFRACSKQWSSQVRRHVIHVIIDDGAKPLLAHSSPGQFQQITTLTTSAESILWISAHTTHSALHNPEKGLITGFSRVARKENTTMNFVTVDIQQSISDESHKTVAAMSKLLVNTFGSIPQDENSKETELIYRDDQIYIPRLLPNVDFDQWMDEGQRKKDQGLFLQHAGPSLKLGVEAPGLLDSLVFVQDDLALEPIGPDEVEIETKAHGVNFKDVYIALGQMKPGERMTGESAGIVTRVGSNVDSKFKIGDRVLGFGAMSPFPTHSRFLGDCAFQIPASMSFTTAASIPVVYLTAYISLVKIAKLAKGQTVLIHAASGGVGQAAVMIAQQIGATIFATVGSTSKSDLLVERYGMPQSHIFSSRLRTFKQGILRLTRKKGVDVVLNSLSGDYLHDTWACIAMCGTFIEIGKADILKRNRLSMTPFDKMVTFASFDLGVLKDCKSWVIATALKEIMSLFDKGAYKPVEPITVFPISDIEEAFRLIQARKHRGKIILNSRDDATVKILSIRPPLKLMGDATFVIAGGLGDLGRRICVFLAQCGAKHIVTLSRRTQEPVTLQAFQNETRALGAEVHMFVCDINEEARVREIAAICQATLPPVRAVVQAAMILQDRSLSQMELDVFMTAVKPKANGTRHVYEAFRNDSLDNFIMLSSVAAILGNPGQGNYAAGCSYEDALANGQHDSNTHFISLNLGLVEGSDIDTAERRAYLLAQGAVPVQMKELFSLLEYTLSSQARNDKCHQIISRLDRDFLSDRLGNLVDTPLLSHLQTTTNSKDTRTSGVVSVDVESSIRSAKTPEEIHTIILNAIVKKISSLVALGVEDIGMDVPIAELGLDSLVAIELKNWIVRNLLAQVQTVEILDMPSIRHLASVVQERSTLASKVSQQAKVDARSEVADSISITAPDVDKALSCCRAAKETRFLPLHDLDQILQSYLLGVRHLVSEEEYINSIKATQEFKRPGSSGQALYAQLVRMEQDPAVENWMEDLYLHAMYLSRRSPTALYYDIMGTFDEFPIHHTQAERAAIIATTAFKFKQDLETGHKEPGYLNEIPLCMESQNWLFNTTRVPLIGSDKVVKVAGPEFDYLIVLRNGHFFKVPLTDKDGNRSIKELQTSFQHILDIELEDSWIGILTADERDSWATIRDKTIKMDPRNEDSICAIDGAAFLICLDDNHPTTPEERIRTFMLDRGINRWHDKSLQFLVASNSSTGFIGDHTKLDGSSVHQLLGTIKTAISTHQPQASISISDRTSLPHEELCFWTNSDIDREIARMRKTWLEQCSNIDYANLECTTFGTTYLKERKCNPQSIFEVVAQLASYMMFERFEACWQPVNMSHYHKGRTEIIQTLTQSMHAFITAALPSPSSPSPSTPLLPLLQAAAREHTHLIIRAQQGHGYHRTLTAMEMLAKQQGLELPALYSDATWLKTGPELIMTGPRDGLFSEVASVWPREEAVFVNYEVLSEEAKFSIVGHAGRAKVYAGLIEKAAGIVKGVLDAE